jgi:hypothetical protein
VDPLPLPLRWLRPLHPRWFKVAPVRARGRRLSPSLRLAREVWSPLLVVLRQVGRAARFPRVWMALVAWTTRCLLRAAPARGFTLVAESVAVESRRRGRRY